MYDGGLGIQMAKQELRLPGTRTTRRLTTVAEVESRASAPTNQEQNLLAAAWTGQMSYGASPSSSAGMGQRSLRERRFCVRGEQGGLPAHPRRAIQQRQPRPSRRVVFLRLHRTRPGPSRVA